MACLMGTLGKKFVFGCEEYDLVFCGGHFKRDEDGETMVNMMEYTMGLDTVVASRIARQGPGSTMQ
eukprot:6162969-Pyramimonas_sp.AAC.1